MRFIGFISIICLLSWGLTWVLRIYALKACLLDLPNHRSSHTVPTPRVGGVAIVMSFLVGVAFLYHMGQLSLQMTLGFVVPGLLVALLGFLDDLYALSVRLRLCVQILISVGALYCLQGMPVLSVFGFMLPSNGLLQIMAIFYLVWLLNLYNFMDGIDGLAGAEAVSVCLGGALLYAVLGYDTFIWVPLVLAAATAGFLYWNMPFARIFMGDAGSGFLGLLMGILSIQAAQVQPPLFWSWLILLGVFIVDATVTLLRRLVQGRALHEAHRSHAYQRLAQRCNRHWPVTLLICVVNGVWLLPMALLVSLGYIDGSFGLLIAYAPLIGLIFRDLQKIRIP